VEYIEPYLKERLDAALEKARRLVQNKIETVDDLNMALRVTISEFWGFPLFDKYYDDKTIDQLAFEAFFIKERNTTGAQTVAQEAAEHTEDAVKAIEDDFAAFESFEPKKPTAEERQQMLDFMSSGKFPGEKK